jgi:glutamate--cysteine ligase
LVDRFGWNPIIEGGKIIGCEKDRQSVTLEPGGQFELSGAPLSNLHQTCDEVNSHLYQAKTISKELNIGFMGLGFDPKSTHEQCPMMPKGRYNIMRQYMTKVGTLGLDMMFRSCTIQV